MNRAAQIFARALADHLGADLRGFGSDAKGARATATAAAAGRDGAGAGADADEET